MKINQMFHIFRWLALACILFFTSTTLSQNFVSDIKQNGNSVESMKINITSSTGNKILTEIRKKITVNSGSILEVPNSVTVYITSLNKNVGAITGPCTVQFTATKTSEEYRIIDGKETCVVYITTNVQLIGNVLLSGPTKTVQALSELTQFSLKYDGNDLEFELIEGKIDVSRREKVEINDKNKIDKVNTRMLFTRESIQLSKHQSKQNYNANSLDTVSFIIDHDIDKFFKKQYVQQKRMYSKAGELSKQAFKLLENKSIEKGKDLLEQANSNGEITWDFIIQSALMMADVNFNKGDLDKSKTWLAVGLQFCDYYLKKNQDTYNLFNNGNDKIAKAFGSDLIVANQYYDWGYTLKLKVYGCLENAKENPSIYRLRAKNLKDEIKDY